MITVDLRSNRMSLDDLLASADQEAVLIIRTDGTRLVLERADEFDQEVAQLGQSERFMTFLEQRAQQPGGLSLEAFERRLREQEEQQLRPPSE